MMPPSDPPSWLAPFVGVLLGSLIEAFRRGRRGRELLSTLVSAVVGAGLFVVLVGPVADRFDQGTASIVRWLAVATGILVVVLLIVARYLFGESRGLNANPGSTDEPRLMKR